MRKNDEQIIEKSVKFSEKHFRTIILPLQGLQEAQNVSKRLRGDHFTEFWGSPGTPLGSQKSVKSEKKWSPKIYEKSEGFKRASQSRFRPIWGGQKLQNEVKNESEMIFESEKTDFCKSAYFVGPADAGRLSRS